MEWRPPSKDLMTVSEVAGRLRVSRMTIYRMIDRGEIEHVRIGRIVRIPAAELVRLETPVEL